MTNQKRGSEKLLNNEDGLCELTAEELSQVAGMGPIPTKPPKYIKIDLPPFRGGFPRGEPNPLLFQSRFDQLLNIANLNRFGG